MKGINYSDVPWRRQYLANTVAWEAIGWQGRAVFDALHRKLDRSGTLSLDGEDPDDAVKALTGIPLDVVKPGLKALIARDWLLIGDGPHGQALVEPFFLEAEEATRSDAARKRESRARQAVQRLLPDVIDITPDSQGLVATSQSVTDRHETSQDVTKCHAGSQSVTPSLSFPSRPVPSRPQKRKRRAPALPVPTWAKTAAKGSPFSASHLMWWLGHCIHGVAGTDEVGTTKTASMSILSLWRAREMYENFWEDFCLVATAAHHSENPVFAKFVRAEGWDEGVDRQFSTTSIAVQGRWDERLMAAKRWRKRGSDLPEGEGWWEKLVPPWKTNGVAPPARKPPAVKKPQVFAVTAADFEEGRRLWLAHVAKPGWANRVDSKGAALPPVDADEKETWFDPLEPFRCDARLYLKVPNEHFAHTLKESYASQLGDWTATDRDYVVEGATT